MPNKSSEKKQLINCLNRIKKGEEHWMFSYDFWDLAEELGMENLLEEAVILGKELAFHNLLDKIKNGDSIYIWDAKEYCFSDYDPDIGECGLGEDHFAEANERLLYFAIQKCNQINPSHTDDFELPTPIQQRIERLVCSSPTGYKSVAFTIGYLGKMSGQDWLSETLNTMDIYSGKGRPLSEVIAEYYARLRNNT